MKLDKHQVVHLVMHLEFLRIVRLDKLFAVVGAVIAGDEQELRAFAQVRPRGVILF